MFIKRVCLVALVLVAFVFAMGCEKSEDRSAADTAGETTADVAGEAVEKTEVSFAETKDAYVKTAKAAVAEWDGKIEKLVEMKDALPEAARKPFEEPMSNLLSSRDDVSKKFAAVENSGEDTFEEKRSELDSAMGNLENAYQKAASLF